MDHETYISLIGLYLQFLVQLQLHFRFSAFCLIYSSHSREGTYSIPTVTWQICYLPILCASQHTFLQCLSLVSYELFLPPLVSVTSYLKNF